MTSGRLILERMRRKLSTFLSRPTRPNTRKRLSVYKKDRESLLVFYDYPAQHWQSIRTSNPIESTFGTIRHRTKRSKGCLSRDGMLHMMFKLGMCAEKRWRKLRGFNYLAKVIEGVQFKDGIEVESNNQVAAYSMA